MRALVHECNITTWNTHAGVIERSARLWITFTFADHESHKDTVPVDNIASHSDRA